MLDAAGDSSRLSFVTVTSSGMIIAATIYRSPNGTIPVIMSRNK